MFKPKFRFTYDEVRIIVMALIEFKNQLLAEGRYTDAIDDLLINIKGKLSTLSVDTVALDLAVHKLRELVRYIEAKTCALDICGILLIEMLERIEYLLDIRLLDANTGILDAEP